MHARSNRTRRALLLPVVIAAAALGAGAFASPASAQVPTPEEVGIDDGSPVTVGGEPVRFSAEVVFGEDLPAGHTVTMTILFDTPAGAIVPENDADDDDCTTDGPYAADCSLDVDGDRVSFDFLYAATDAVEDDSFAYFASFAVDGATVETVEGAIEVLPVEEGPGEAWPYLHGDAVFTGVEPGSTVEVQPEFLQEQALGDDAAAVILTFSEPEYPFSEGRGADASAGYDNCTDRYFDSPGVTCVVTDFADAPGTVFTPTVPVHYAVSERAPGPVDVCVCYYSAYVVNAAELEDRFGDVDWDAGSGNLFGLRVVSEPESEFADSTVGEIVITTADHPWDLAVDDANAKGALGSKTTVTVEVVNDGPADAYDFFDGPGSYALLGRLPTGLDLVSIDEEGWICLDEADWETYLPSVDPGDLAKLDFACLFDEIAAGETHELPVRVEITGTGAKRDGTLEVVTLDNDGYPGVLEADPKDNSAVFSVNADGHGQLPKTGSSLTPVLGIAAAALVAGVLLFVLTRRRGPSEPASEPEAEE
ncbi:LPXTG cell wall anchor domain-containing protein [Glycomyces harbinensis]|uniref:LPXTG-motif cell wall anchor domain-containing protein n=1 Tax=Glycomyces harbinensis TaxID=58114 RepID=A0A1G6YT69_9ACTN|nr:LPXTG cell wall anchor domain-containing protein [Glycomyces harbinensis]SDD93530.1 LPXTG-motif cell wall anchor domain-containing protein [Glycomyces harbinensis]